MVDKRKTRVEVLAPAGSFDIMKAVVAAGADAVYLGGNMFGARYEKKATLAGGIILVLIGLKILLEHLGVLG